MDLRNSDKTEPQLGNHDLSQTIASTESGAHRAIDAAADAALPAAERLASGAHHAVDKAKDVATHAAESFGDKVESLKHAKSDVFTACNNYLRASPLASLAIAAGVGMLVSRLLADK